MRRTEPLRSFIERVGYGEECAVCPFCGKINDSAQPETRCHHLVQWNTHEHEALLIGATFTDSPRQEKQNQEQAEREAQEKKERGSNP